MDFLGDCKFFLFVGITSIFKPAETGYYTGDLDCNCLLNLLYINQALSYYFYDKFPTKGTVSSTYGLLTWECSKALYLSFSSKQSISFGHF